MNKNIEVILETERLLIRKWEPEDFKQYNFLCQESMSGNFFEGWAMDKEKAKGFFEWQLSKYMKMDPKNDAIGLAIEEKETGQIIGHAGIGKHDDLDETELFYGIIKSKRGNGFAIEAARIITDWASNTFELPYIIGTIEENNIPSQKVLERCGYQLFDKKQLKVIVLDQIDSFLYYRYYK